jgi:hypothetical protein
MSATDLRDFYIKYEGHPRFTTNKIIEDEAVEIIINKIEMILFTNKGEVFGDPDFGADLYFFLHKTKVAAETVETIIDEQFKKYIPELATTSYTLKVTILPGTFQDVLYVDINVDGVEINAYFN